MAAAALGPPDAMAPDVELDEFEQIARLYRPLTQGSPEALGLLDDVAVVPSRPGFDLVLTKDAMVEGVHFLPGEPLDLVARKLLRSNLSDLAAKAAEPHGYLLAVAWPPGIGIEARSRFAAGLAEDQAAFGVRLLGGDTVSTSGPLVASLTLLGWTPSGRLVRRDGAQAGDVVMASGTIGDAGLGLAVLRGERLEGVDAAASERLVGRHRLPTPRLALQAALRRYASAAVDVSDGLIADAGHIGRASGVGLRLHLERLPFSADAAAWLQRQPDVIKARVRLATSGEDFEVVCTVASADVADFIAAAHAAQTRLSVLGEVVEGLGVETLFEGRPVVISRPGWIHP